MEVLTEAEKAHSLKSFRSTIRKSENALSRMTEKGANTTLVSKRLQALRIGLAVLEQVWDEKPHLYTHEDLKQARILLGGFASLDRRHLCQVEGGQSPENSSGKKDQVAETGHSVDG